MYTNDWKILIKMLKVPPGVKDCRWVDFCFNLKHVFPTFLLWVCITIIVEGKWLSTKYLLKLAHTREKWNHVYFIILEVMYFCSLWGKVSVFCLHVINNGTQFPVLYLLSIFNASSAKALTLNKWQIDNDLGL